MGLTILIDVLGVAALLGLWYFYFAHYNRRKGALALRWVETACSSKGRILKTRWFGACRLQAHLDFAAHWFENARVIVRLRPRPIPLKWLFSLWRKQRETLTFEADLDMLPTSSLKSSAIAGSRTGTPAWPEDRGTGPSRVPDQSCSRRAPTGAMN